MSILDFDPQPLLAQLRFELEEHVEAILAAKSQGGTTHYDAGTHFNAIEEKGMARALEYGTIDDLIAQRLPSFSRRTLFMWGAVAKHFSREDAARYGIARLARLIRYEHEVLGAARTGDPGEREVQVPDGRGNFELKKFRELSARALERACRSQSRRT